MRDKIHRADNLSVPFSGMKETLPTFPTKKAALEAGREFGWSDAVQLLDRFEKVWVVGRLMLGDDERAGVARHHFRFPLLRWETDYRRIKFCPVLTVYRVIPKAA